LLDGLEAVELKLSDVLEDNDSKRIDSNYFKKEYLKAYLSLKSKEYKLNKNISTIRSGTTPKDRDENLKKGVILLKTNDIRNNILLDEKNNFFYINKVTDEKMKSTRLKTGDVLLNIVGATTSVIGRSSLVSDVFPKSNITQAMVFNRIKDINFLPEYLFIFFQTYYGQIQVKRLARPTGQYNLNLNEVGKFIIPKISTDFQLKIASLIKLGHQNLDKRKASYQQAETLLLTELDLLNFKPSAENIAIKSFGESFGNSGRLDSEYYQPKYDEIIKKIKNYKNGWRRIREVLTSDIKSGTTPKEIKKEFIKNSNYFLRAESFNDDLTLNYDALYSLDDDAFKKHKNITVQKFDVLVSMTGTIGNVAIITKDINAMINQNVVKLSVNEELINHHVFAVFMKTVGKSLLTREQTGNVQPYVNIPNFSNLIIPIIKESAQTQIEQKIKASFKLKAESKQLLDLAKHAVEMAIEQSEEQAIKLIDAYEG